MFIYISLPVFPQYLCHAHYTWSPWLYTFACEVSLFPFPFLKQSKERHQKTRKLLRHGCYIMKRIYNVKMVRNYYICIVCYIYLWSMASWLLQQNCNPDILPSKWSIAVFNLKFAIFFHTDFNGWNMSDIRRLKNEYQKQIVITFQVMHLNHSILGNYNAFCNKHLFRMRLKILVFLDIVLVFI
jgi:hypothetical protein